MSLRTIGLTVALWVVSWLLVYLYQLITTPPRLAADSQTKIGGLEEEISKRGARVAAVQALMDLYERSFILGANPQNDSEAVWMTKYDKWKEDVVKVLTPLSHVEPWMFKTLGDHNLFGKPMDERQKFLVLFQEFKGRREKLRRIISRLLPPDHPLYTAMGS